MTCHLHTTIQSLLYFSLLQQLHLFPSLPPVTAALQQHQALKGRQGIKLQLGFWRIQQMFSLTIPLCTNEECVKAGLVSRDPGQGRLDTSRTAQLNTWPCSCQREDEYLKPVCVSWCEAVCVTRKQKSEQSESTDIHDSTVITNSYLASPAHFRTWLLLSNTINPAVTVILWFTWICVSLVVCLSWRTNEVSRVR